MPFEANGLKKRKVKLIVHVSLDKSKVDKIIFLLTKILNFA